MSEPFVSPSTPWEEEEQRRAQMLLRTIPISLLPIIGGFITALVIQAFLGPPPDSIRPAVPQVPELLVALTIFVTCITAIILVRISKPTISVLLFIGIWTLLATLAALQGSITMFFPALLILPICAAGLLLSGGASIVLTVLATAVIIALAWLGTANPNISKVQSLLALGPASSLVAAVFWIVLFWTVAALTWMLAGNLHRALAQSRRQTAQLAQLSANLEARVAAQTAELARRTERAEALYQVGRALGNTLDLQQVLQLITEQAARLLNFESSAVLLDEPEEGDFALVSAYCPPAGIHNLVSAATPALRTLLAERQLQVASLAIDDGEGPTPAAALLLPMHYSQRVIGVLMLLDCSPSAARSADDLALAEGLADHAALAIMNAQLVARLHEAATLEERTRLARDIHDTLAQGLTGIVVQLTAAHQALDRTPAEASEHLDLAQRMARESLAEARRSVWNLRAGALERGTLVDALRGLAERLGTRMFRVSFAVLGEVWSLPLPGESALLRVCQEALANVIKHARATEVSILLAYTAESVTLSVADNGVGFDTTALHHAVIIPGPWGGFGLLGMRERLTTLGGTLDVASSDGTLVRAILPRPVNTMPELYL